MLGVTVSGMWCRVVWYACNNTLEDSKYPSTAAVRIEATDFSWMLIVIYQTTDHYILADHIIVFNIVRTSNIKAANEPFKMWQSSFFWGGGFISRLCPYYCVILHSYHIFGIQHPCFALHTDWLEKIVMCRVIKVKLSHDGKETGTRLAVLWIHF